MTFRSSAAQTGDTQPDVSARLNRLMRSFADENHKMWKEAYNNKGELAIAQQFSTDNMSVEVAVSVDSLFDAAGNRNKKKFPAEQALGTWDASCARAAISTDGVVLVAAFPNFLKNKAHVSHRDLGRSSILDAKSKDILFDIMMSFGEMVKIALRQGADQKTRDAAESYMRQEFDGELSGVFQLVLLWKAVGHTVRAISPCFHSLSSLLRLRIQRPDRLAMCSRTSAV